MLNQLLNTLYVQTDRCYLRINRDTLKIEVNRKTEMQIPLHHLGGLAVFGNVMMSPWVIMRFADGGRDIAWFTKYGRFVGRLQGATSGNVLLREAQHEVKIDEQRTIYLIRQFVIGKLRNARHLLVRGRRELKHADQNLESRALGIQQMIQKVEASERIDEIRGFEGRGAVLYFDGIKSLIRSTEPQMQWNGRNRRPPRDPVNALLSFAYALVTNECTAACEGVGLDPQMGFLHTLRPGRPSLALDLAEEFRSTIADRTVMAVINRRQLQAKHFNFRPGGSVLLSDEGRKIFLSAYQTRKEIEVTHPVLKQRVATGLLPHIQARLLARYIRGDAPVYTPYQVR